MKKYSIIILSILVAIAAIVFGISQVFVGCDSVTEISPVGGEPYSVGPTTAPYVTPPTTQPPGQ